MVIPSASRLSINQATFQTQWDVYQFLEACASNGVSLVSLREPKLTPTRAKRVSRVVAENGLRVLGYHHIGPLLVDDGDDGALDLDCEKRKIDNAALLDARYAMVFTGGLVGKSRDLNSARAKLAGRLETLIVYAREQGVTLALEPLHPMLVGDRTVIASLSHANSLCEHLGDGVGVVVDAYHVWWDERLEVELEKLAKHGRILAFHVNDWLSDTRNRLTDRGMMGDGIIDLAGIWKTMRDFGFDGPIEVEIFSEHWWDQDPYPTLRVSIERCEQLFFAR